MRWPGTIEAGQVSREIASIMDLYPTFSKLAGAKLPADRQIDGKSILPLMLDGSKASSPHQSYFYYTLTQLQAVRMGKWKLVLPRTADSPYVLWLGKYMDTVETVQLFDLEADIAEQHDLAEDKPEVVARLMQEVESARAELGDYNRIGTGARFFDEGSRRPHTYFPARQVKAKY